MTIKDMRGFDAMSKEFKAGFFARTGGSGRYPFYWWGTKDWWVGWETADWKIDGKDRSLQFVDQRIVDFWSEKSVGVRMTDKEGFVDFGKDTLVMLHGREQVFDKHTANKMRGDKDKEQCLSCEYFDGGGEG